ncbi:hypothetical protein AYI69_g2917 [Smittium culicis]|uniref:Uncharacterized protein n=1 Tax=Smittium culicis TaxID=133412 RepID=A0A1R1YLA1_9FUNG|nr:hypothetical protein AYI69_g2917 [Smittium culicis]
MGVDRSMHEIHKSFTVEANCARTFDYHSQVGTDPLSENHKPRYDHGMPRDFLESFNNKESRPTERIKETYSRRKEDSQMLRKLYRKGKSYFGDAFTGKINAASTAGAEEPILVEDRFMEIDGLSTKRSKHNL